ncbi:MAG: tripartite tricarboxylate transporter substrate-binding protein [Steroidobacteraceae bacterium]
MRTSAKVVAFLVFLLPDCAVTYAAHSPAAEQGFPARPVLIIEPFGLGGGPDLLARALATELSKLWGQPVVVENHPGAGATAGPAQVAKSPADGYTLLLNTSAQAYSAAFLNSLPYDPLKDFIPVAALTSQPYVLVAGKGAGITSLRQLISSAKARPGELTFTSTGMGTATHIGVEKLNQMAEIRTNHVPPLPSESNADVMASVIAGRVTYYLAPISLALPHIRDGTLVALGVSTARRSTLLPEVPTIAEVGVARFNFPIWYGIWAPAGTPKSVVVKLSTDIGRVIGESVLRDWITTHGGVPMSITQRKFAHFVQVESKDAARIIKPNGMKPQGRP